MLVHCWQFPAHGELGLVLQMQGNIVAKHCFFCIHLAHHDLEDTSKASIAGGCEV